MQHQPLWPCTRLPHPPPTPAGPHPLPGAGEPDGDAIEKAFSKKRVEDRKEWLRAFVPGTYLDQSATHISYTDFIDKVRPPPRRRPLPAQHAS